MSTNEPVSLTRGEVVDLHLNPDCLFCSPRRVADPVDVRYGDDRVQRFSNGSISVYFGYYTEAQRLCREAYGKMVMEKFEAAGGSFMKMFLTRDK